MRYLMILGLLAALAPGLPAAAAEEAVEIVGPAQVADGDTLRIGATWVRLHGLDAPETGQLCGSADGGDWDCGAAARDRLAALVAGRELRCLPIDRDRYDRVVARCSADGADLGGTLVGEGLAWAYLRYSAAYVAAETGARALRRGLWQGPAQVAWDYRARGFDGGFDGGFVEASGGGDLNCVIKGNINAEGEKIYHLPASPWYDRVEIDETQGQRWFCDEAEAEAAGWRAARGQ